MALGFWQILLIIALIFLLFGSKRIPSLMNDLAQGIKAFKKGMSDDNNQTPPKD